MMLPVSNQHTGNSLDEFYCPANNEVRYGQTIAQGIWSLLLSLPGTTIEDAC